MGDGLERLIQRIEAQSVEQAAQIIETAQKEASSILESAQLLAGTERTKFRNRLEVEIKSMKERKISRAELSARDEVLKAKRDILEAVYARALVLLEAMEGEPLFEFLLKQIQRVIRGGNVTVIMNERTAGQLPENACESIQRVCREAGVDMELREERRKIANGFQLVQGGVVYDFTYGALVGEFRESAEPQLAEQLFKGV